MNDAAGYVPDPSELDDAERQFLGLVAPLGLDFLSHASARPVVEHAGDSD